ncbi:nuclease-related domain-containing DEAD/DEAH box helicase [Nocardioides taihuensis]|uniref:NERD domain-containing protein n=1 Tax=Nocardioides taihuensis TaxID=1835606 RepID=A0ABW0BLB2_9ACTN
MVRVVPDRPTSTTASEQQVWDWLRAGLDPDDMLLANLRLTDEDKDHEADLVVLLPDVGIVVVEVKGGSVWCDESGWWQRSRGRDKKIDPVTQVRTTKYAIRDYVARDPRWGRRNHVAWGHAVVAPYSDFPDDWSTPDCPRWSLHGRRDQADLVERIRENARRAAQGKPAPTYDDVDLIVEILAGRLPTSYDVNAEAAERAAVADRLTQEQATILQVTRLLRRVEVRGGAGSGKTVLALQQAKELTRGRGERRAERVALLCYSIGLAEYLKRQVAGWHRKERPAFVGTFEEFGRQWGVEGGSREDSAFWEETLPRLMGELAAELPDGKKYDSIVVDEAQDFADSWWRPVLGALRDEEEGGLYVYSDENQRIFARFGRPPVALVPLVLDHNLRNTRQIHGSFGPLAPSRMYARGGDGREVRFVACTADDAIQVADDEVVALLDEGWDPANVALLTTGHRHPEQQAQTERHGHLGYWRSFWEGDDVFYGHVLGSKGLERAAVVLCLNEREPRDRARERLYVGMSRATDVLVVVGDRAFVREVGGHEVAKRLGIDS